jgi:predicted RNA-binding Zn-ribbon protein involved in translation (DUF1610 family)
MAHKIYTKKKSIKCPLCGESAGVRFATYHFGTTYTAECANCGFGKVEGDNEDMALARYKGEVLKAEKFGVKKPKKEKTTNYTVTRIRMLL